MMDTYYRTDAGGGIIMVSPAVVDLLGFEIEEVIGLQLAGFYLEEDGREAFLQALRAGGGRLANYEAILVHKNGSEVWVSTNARYSTDETGAVVGVEGTVRNITERKRAEEALMESEAKYRGLVETSHDLIWKLDEEGCFTYLNPAWEETLGHHMEDMLGHLFTDFKNPAEAARTLEVYKETLAGGYVGNYETTYISKSGQELAFNFNAIPTYDSHGTIIGTQGTAQNITERKTAEEAKRRSEEKFRNFVENSPAAISLKDLEGRFTMINRQFEVAFGASAEGAIGKTTRDFFPREVAERVLEQDREVIGQGTVVSRELALPMKDGSTMQSINTKFPLLDGHGGITGVGTLTTDISIRKSLEEQLRQSQKMQALGTMAGGIAHDFNNILSPILGFSELLLEDLESSSESHASAAEILKSAKRAKDLVSQILLFGRRGLAEKKVFNLVPLAREVAAFVGATLPKTIVIREDIATEAAPVFCDSTQVHQVLVNLLVNAGQAILGIGEIKFALETVELEGFECIAGEPLSGKHIRIAVTDNGAGMDGETLGHIFEPFYTTKGVGEGTGLGLSTVFGIVQNHGGGIAVSTEAGKGTTFEVFLPVAEGAIEPIPTPPDRFPAGGTENILFVDDEEAITKLGMITLERVGYNVTVASDGQEAFQVFSENPERFDLVVTDQTMPNMTGDQLAKKLLKQRPNLPIILCTGHTPAISLEGSKKIGINSLLFKPISPTELVQVVREVLDKERPA